MYFPSEGLADKNMQIFEVLGTSPTLMEIGFFPENTVWNRIDIESYDPIAQEKLKRMDDSIKIEGKQYQYRLLFSTHIG